jgi:hypothetical protein
MMVAMGSRPIKCDKFSRPRLSSSSSSSFSNFNRKKKQKWGRRRRKQNAQHHRQCGKVTIRFPMGLLLREPH